MKRLIFGKGLMEVTLAGNKKITIRKYREGSHDFIEGEVVCGEFMDGLNILLRVTKNTEKKPFSEITDTEAQEDGFNDAEHAFSGLGAYYPDLQKTEMSATIRFEILNVDDTPVVSTNEYAQ